MKFPGFLQRFKLPPPVEGVFMVVPGIYAKRPHYPTRPRQFTHLDNPEPPPAVPFTPPVLSDRITLTGHAKDLGELDEVDRGPGYVVRQGLDLVAACEGLSAAILHTWTNYSESWTVWGPGVLSTEDGLQMGGGMSGASGTLSYGDNNFKTHEAALPYFYERAQLLNSPEADAYRERLQAVKL